MQRIRLRSHIMEAVKTGGINTTMNHEVITLAEELQANPLLYQVMEIAVSIQAEEAIQQATAFLKKQKNVERRGRSRAAGFSGSAGKEEQHRWKEMN